MVRVFLLVVFLLSCFSAGGRLYVFFSSRDDSPSHYDHTHRTVARLREGSTLAEGLSMEQEQMYSLCCQGFSLQMQRKFQESEEIFSRIHKRKTSAPFVLQRELLEGRILNAYFLNNLSLMAECITELEKVSGVEAHLLFFKALHAYRTKQYHLAVDVLSRWFGHVDQTKPFCLDTHVYELFSPYVLEEMAAESLIGARRYAEGRIVINSVFNKIFAREYAWSVDMYNRLVLMLGQSYLLELQEGVRSDLLPEYYETILFYQKQMKGFDAVAYKTFFPESMLVPTIMQHIFVIPETQLPLFMDALLMWENSYVHPDYSLVLERMKPAVLQDGIRTQKICQAIADSKIKKLKEKLIELFSDELVFCVSQGNTVCADQYLALLKMLDPRSSWGHKLLLSEKEIVNMVCEDDAQYSRLKDYLLLWEEQDIADVDRQQLMHYLFFSAKHLWRGGQEEACLRLLKEILVFSQNEKACLNRTLRLVKHFYTQALAMRNFTHLVWIENFLDEVGLPKTLASDAEIANCLADAQYLFAKGDYRLCIVYSSWLARVAPSTEALQLLGLSLVEQKEYTEALEVFQRLPLGEDTWNSQVHKASLLCYKYIARQQKEKSFP
ncbi:DUF1347 family protein [Chlamydia trachomatis]|uniref:DUF1347 family protein n=1 Tax=Chlamydia trachomatis TaxID=813 RepID=UPI0002A7BC5E|nr:DUF1347 family protein [Chlamydia trachomatis]CCP58228.1 hypothetical protein SOTONG1_00689 [Chlamydia trachomatis G/SotonG1]